MGKPSPRLWLVFGVALLARLAFFYAGPFQDPSRAILEDSSYYHELASNLVREGRFGVRPEQQSGMQAVLNRARTAAGDAPRAESGLLPESFRTPGYPVFIAAASLGMREVRLVLLLQCLLGALAAVMVVVLAGRLGFNGWIPVAAGLVWALHPALVTYDNLVLTESTFVFCTVAAYLLATDRRPVAGVLAAAALLGVATLIRPPLGFVFLPGIIALAWPQLTSRRMAVAAAAVVLAALPAGLWALRNAGAGEGFRVSTVGDLSLVFYTAPCAVSEARGDDCDSAYPRRWAEIEARLRGELREGDDVLALARRNALNDLGASLDGAAKMYLKSVVKLGISHSLGASSAALGRPYRPTGLFSALVLREQGTTPVRAADLWLPLGWVLVNAALLVLALAGLGRALYARRWRLLVALGVTSAAFVLTAGAVGQERIRLPMMMPLLLLGTAAVADLRRTSEDRHFFSARPATDAVEREA